ncbi:MAG TPA: hypothetical protein VFC41_03925 [Anaerovoracaceae bacterium]|nr:hypothetical protein [Anaerovoracaceae bacterium]
MFNSKISRILSILALFLLIGLFVWFIILPFVAIGPGYPSPEYLKTWYIPSGVHGYRIGETGSPSPIFPALSQYSEYANYTRRKSDDRYLISEWYFDDRKEFLQAEAVLYQYLKEHGRLSTVQLNISEELKIIDRGLMYGPATFNATKYESEMTSGYFMTYKDIFGPDNYFIVYHGSMGLVNLSNQTQFLKTLIADSYPSGPRVMVGGLNE